MSNLTKETERLMKLMDAEVDAAVKEYFNLRTMDSKTLEMFQKVMELYNGSKKLFCMMVSEWNEQLRQTEDTNNKVNLILGKLDKIENKLNQ